MGIDITEMANRGQERASNGTIRSSRGKTLLQIKGSLADALVKYAENVLEKAIRPAVFAGADHMYKEMTQRVPVSLTANQRGSNKKDGPVQPGKEITDNYHHAQLLQSLYVYFDKAKGTQTKPLYYIGPNKGEAKHWWLIEYGHYSPLKHYQGKDGQWYTNTKATRDVPKFIAPRPYIRPTYDANNKLVIDIMRNKLRDELYKVRK